MKRIIVLLLLLPWLPPSLFAELPQVVGNPSGKDGAFFSFFIKSVAPDTEGNVVITAVALDGTTPVSLELILGRKWESPAANPAKQAGQLKALGFGKRASSPMIETDPKIRNGSAIIRGTGAPTEAFVRAVARTLKVKMPPYEFSEATFHAISLGASPSRMAAEPIDMKLTLGAMTDHVFASLFCHLDIPHRFLQLQEEYPENQKWRESLVTVLTRKAAALAPAKGRTTQPSPSVPEKR